MTDEGQSQQERRCPACRGEYGPIGFLFRWWGDRVILCPNCAYYRQTLTRERPQRVEMDDPRDTRARGRP